MSLTKSYFLFLFFLIFANQACNPGQKATNSIPEVSIEYMDLDTLTVTAHKIEAVTKAEDFSLPPYSPSYTRKNDLLHTRLEIRFDWSSQAVIGKAELTLKALFYPVRKIRLHALNFDIHKVSFAGLSNPLKYDYDGAVLTIDLGREYSSSEKYNLYIEYTAHPSTPYPGHEEIASDGHGLYFINHDGSQINKPQQIWTQGETEYNSRWFPTIDKPVERCTQETYLTVDEKFKTLSNGTLVSSKKNNDGTRTDYWKMDQAHAPYLFVVVVGEYAIVKDFWNGKPIEYYVEPEFEKDARAIFNHTPEMLTFFSDLLGVEYPWPKYSQVVVRDFVAGAMENTTGVTFGEFVQQHAKDLVDNENDQIVAHEMFHHWFGDLVTCESWANLTLNEGFANYSEYLWYEYKYGRDAADQILRNEQEGYLDEAGFSGAHPLIHYGYDDKEDMFDAHSYNKGGAVLHMLRSYLGDEAFFAALKKYLRDHAFTAVEVDELRMAFEDVSGEDLNWFFNQWYMEAGHPVLEIGYTYDEAAKKINVTIEQTQDPEKNPAIFILPMAIDIYIGKAAPTRHEVTMNLRKQTFSFDAIEEPVLVNIDAEKTLLCVKNDSKSEEAYIYQYYHGNNYRDRWEALETLEKIENPATENLFRDALKDSFWGLRRKAMGGINPDGDAELLEEVVRLAKEDPHSLVRAGAMELLGDFGDASHIELLKNAYQNDPSSNGEKAALKALAYLDSGTAYSLSKMLEKKGDLSSKRMLADVYGIIGNPESLSFFENNFVNFDGYSAFRFFDNYFQVLKNVKEDSRIDQSVILMQEIGTDTQYSIWKRYSATKVLLDISNDLAEKNKMDKAREIHTVMQKIIQTEKDPQLQEVYKRF